MRTSEQGLALKDFRWIKDDEPKTSGANGGRCFIPDNVQDMIANDNSTRLAADRTRLALERTLMAWVRTAISLITFGFGFYKAGQLVSADHAVHQSWLGPRQFGLIMILIGLLTLILGTREHRVEMQQLQAEFPSHLRRSPARLLAVAVAVLGLAAVFSMIFRR